MNRINPELLPILAETQELVALLSRRFSQEGFLEFRSDTGILVASNTIFQIMILNFRGGSGVINLTKGYSGRVKYRLYSEFLGGSSMLYLYEGKEPLLRPRPDVADAKRYFEYLNEQLRWALEVKLVSD